MQAILRAGKLICLEVWHAVPVREAFKAKDVGHWHVREVMCQDLLARDTDILAVEEEVRAFICRAQDSARAPAKLVPQRYAFCSFRSREAAAERNKAADRATRATDTLKHRVRRAVVDAWVKPDLIEQKYVGTRGAVVKGMHSWRDVRCGHKVFPVLEAELGYCRMERRR